MGLLGEKYPPVKTVCTCSTKSKRPGSEEAGHGRWSIFYSYHELEENVGEEDGAQVGYVESDAYAGVG